jgi:hypothetical protein
MKVKEEADWETKIYPNRDPLLLWAAIVKTHISPSSGAEIQDKMTVRSIYKKLQQGQRETTLNFRERMQTTLDMMTSLKMEVIPAEVVAQDFIQGLDNVRYDSLKTALINGFREYPKTLQDAYRMASLWKISVTKAAGDVIPDSPAQAAVGKMDPSSSSSTVFATTGEGSSGRSNKKKKKNKNSNGNQQQWQQVPPSNNNNNNNNNGNGRPRRSCWRCDSTEHLVRDCPIAKEAKSNLERSSLTSSSSALITSDIGHRRGVRFIDDYEDDINDRVHLLYCTRLEQTCSRLQPALHEDVSSVMSSSFGSGRSPGEDAVMVNMTKSRVDESDFEVLLDSQANISIFRESKLLLNIRKSSEIKQIGGISTEKLMIVNLVGDHPDFGTVFFHPKAAANILCQFDMVRKMGCKIELNDEAHEYRMSNTKTGTVYVFKEWNKLCTCTCEPVVDLLQRLNNPNSSVMQVATVENNIRSYTKREVAQAQAARELQARLGYPSDKTLSEMVSSGIVNCPVTAYDVHRASKIYGPNVANLKGKMISKTGDSVKVEYLPPPVERDQLLEIDVMFVDRDPYLISVSTPLGLTMCTHLENKGKDLQVKLVDHINACLQA